MTHRQKTFSVRPQKKFLKTFVRLITLSNRLATKWRRKVSNTRRRHMILGNQITDGQPTKLSRFFFQSLSLFFFFLQLQNQRNVATVVGRSSLKL